VGLGTDVPELMASGKVEQLTSRVTSPFDANGMFGRLGRHNELARIAVVTDIHAAPARFAPRAVAAVFEQRKRRAREPSCAD